MATSAGREVAVVVGAGIAGLAAARVLADRFARVVLLDRDTLRDTPEPRRGVPQGEHAHLLLLAGQRALEELFPGLEAEVLAGGAVAFDSGADVHLFQRAVWRPTRTGLRFVTMTRPFLETTVRRRVAALSNVEIEDGRAVSGLAGGDGRVTGVVLDDGEELAADLVVDCSGRGSRSDRWLQALGFTPPPTVEMKIGVGYVSQTLRRKPDDLGATAAFVYAAPPQTRRNGGALPVEGDRWLVIVGGWHGDFPEAERDAVLDYARGLPDPAIADLLERAEPLTPPVLYHFPTARRRRFERMSTAPAGYVALGETVCSFNPFYGQGMTVAVQQAQALGRVLDRHGAPTAALTRAYFRAMARLLTGPWLSAAANDLSMPETTGFRLPGAALMGRYARRAQIAAQTDPHVRTVLLAVQHLVAPPAALFAPKTALRVLRSSRRRPATAK